MEIIGMRKKSESERQELPESINKKMNTDNVKNLGFIPGSSNIAIGSHNQIVILHVSEEKKLEESGNIKVDRLKDMVIANNGNIVTLEYLRGSFEDRVRKRTIGSEKLEDIIKVKGNKKGTGKTLKIAVTQDDKDPHVIILKKGKTSVKVATLQPRGSVIKQSPLFADFVQEIKAGRVNCVATCHQTSRFMVGGVRDANKGFVQFYELGEKGKLINDFLLESEVKCLAISHNDKYMVVGSSKNELLYYDLTKELADESTLLYSCEHSVTNIAISRDSDHIAVCSGKEVLIISVKNRKLMARLAHSGATSYVAISHSGKYIATAHEDGISVWPGTEVLGLKEEESKQETLANLFVSIVKKRTVSVSVYKLEKMLKSVTNLEEFKLVYTLVKAVLMEKEYYKDPLHKHVHNSLKELAINSGVSEDEIKSSNFIGSYEVALTTAMKDGMIKDTQRGSLAFLAQKNRLFNSIEFKKIQNEIKFLRDSVNLLHENFKNLADSITALKKALASQSKRNVAFSVIKVALMFFGDQLIEMVQNVFDLADFSKIAPIIFKGKIKTFLETNVKAIAKASLDPLIEEGIKKAGLDPDKFLNEWIDTAIKFNENSSRSLNLEPSDINFSEGVSVSIDQEQKGVNLKGSPRSMISSSSQSNTSITRETFRKSLQEFQEAFDTQDKFFDEYFEKNPSADRRTAIQCAEELREKYLRLENGLERLKNIPQEIKGMEYKDFEQELLKAACNLEKIEVSYAKTKPLPAQTTSQLVVELSQSPGIKSQSRLRHTSPLTGVGSSSTFASNSRSSSSSSSSSSASTMSSSNGPSVKVDGF
jgi:WD40 repeat protein